MVVVVVVCLLNGSIPDDKVGGGRGRRSRSEGCVVGGGGGLRLRRRGMSVGCSDRLTGISCMSQLIVCLKSFPKRECLTTNSTIILRFIQVMGKEVILCLPSMDIQFATVLEGTVIFVGDVIGKSRWIMG